MTLALPSTLTDQLDPPAVVIASSTSVTDSGSSVTLATGVDVRMLISCVSILERHIAWIDEEGILLGKASRAQQRCGTASSPA